MSGTGGTARIRFYEPESGAAAITTAVLRDLLSLVMSEDDIPPSESVGAWTVFERLIVYDWAIREHLSASGNTIMRRPQPWLVSR